MAGGSSGEGSLDTVESYDPASNTWTHVIYMTSPRSGLRAVMHDDDVYLVGGHEGGLHQPSVEKVDVRQRRLTVLRSMSRVVRSVSAVALEGNIFVMSSFEGRWI